MFGIVRAKRAGTTARSSGPLNLRFALARKNLGVVVLTLLSETQFIDKIFNIILLSGDYAMVFEDMIHKAAAAGQLRLPRFSLAIDRFAQKIGMDHRPSIGVSLYRHDATEGVRGFLAAGANPNVGMDRSFPPIHTAIVTDNAQLIEILLAAGADIELPGQYGPARSRKKSMTPLAAAAALGQVQCAKLLLSKGANLESKDSDGLIPYDHASDPELKSILATALFVRREREALAESAASGPSPRKLASRL